MSLAPKTRSRPNYISRSGGQSIVFNSHPLADRMRPRALDEFVGQQHIVGKGKILRTAIESGNLPSIIFWGPPGSGKTTLARIIANTFDAEFVHISGATGGVDEIRKTVEKARSGARLGIKTIIFVDEIHRFNKAQQDRLLPSVEDGTIIFIGATTENPSFEVNSALLSRARVFVLNALEPEDIEQVIKKALEDKTRGLGSHKIKITPKTIRMLADMSNGDARVALNALELAVSTLSSKSAKLAKSNSNNIQRSLYIVTVDSVIIKESLQKSHLLYDRVGEEHYNIISALHKSMRGGDADAALYWLGRMFEAGEDPLYIARRIIRFASEDIGLANSLALPQAVSAYQACHLIGSPECNVNLAQAVVYMAKSKKSNQLYTAYKKVQQDIKNLPNEPVPLHLRNAPTKLMKNLNYGKGYKYTPSYDNPEDAKQDYLPKKLKNRKYL
jgi:putative ATPase